MFATTQRRFLSTLAATIAFCATPLSAVAIEPRQGSVPINDWITINPSGVAQTFSPSVVTSNGARTTTNPPPYSLTGSVYTLTATNGGLTTSSGVPPPPQASNSMGFGGVFPVCNNNAGVDAPFCQPRRGSTLHVETTYYITWDATYFGDPSTSIAIVGYDVSGKGDVDAAPAFSVTNIVASDGWAYWTPRIGDLEEKNSNNMTLILMYTDFETEQQRNITGPVFTIRPPLSTDGSTSWSPNLLAILLPVILITLAIVAVMLWLYYRRRRRHAAAADAAATATATAAAAVKHSNVGYGGHNGQNDRVAGRKGPADIQLEPTSPPPAATPGQNVFQEEGLFSGKRRHRT